MNSRPGTIGWSVVLVTCVLVGIFALPLGAASLPRLVISLPPGTPAGEFARTIAASGVRDGVIVLRSIAARVGGSGSALEAGLPIADPGDLSAGLEPYLDLILTVGDVPGAGREREAAIESRLSDIVSAASLEALPVRGVIVEVEAASAADDALDGRRLPGRSDGRPEAGCSAEAEYAFVHIGRDGSESGCSRPSTSQGGPTCAWRRSSRGGRLPARWNGGPSTTTSPCVS